MFAVPLPAPHHARLLSALRMGLISLAWLFPASPAIAQQTGSLHGVVLDAGTHRPIARVLVESPASGPGVLTDNAGQFSFSGVPFGTVQLRYRRPGYFDPSMGQPTATRTVAFAPDTAAAGQTLLLSPAASLHGQLLLPDGDSAAGLRVDLYQAQVRDGRRGWKVSGTVTVDNGGSFAFDGLQAGSFLVHAQGSIDPTPFGTPPGTRSGYAPVFAPETGDISEATVYALRPGESDEVRIRLSRVPFYPVSIRVAGDAFSFQITGNGFTNWSPRYSREDGTVATELPSGSYLLRASSGGHGGTFGELPFHVDGAPVSGPTLAASETGRIQVETEVAGDSSGNGSGGSPAQSAPRVSFLNFVPVSDVNQQPSLRTISYDQNGATGSLTSSVAPGQYWVSGMGNGGYITSLSSGGVDLFSQPLSILPGTVPSISVTIRQDSGAITVMREGEVAATSCTIQLLPLSPGGLSMMSYAIDTQGAPVVFKNLPPGDYLVVATASPGSIAFREPGVLQQIQGERGTVTPGGSAQVTLSTLTVPPPDATGSF